MATADVTAPADGKTLEAGADKTCERCGSPFAARTSEQRCPSCFAPLRALRKQAGLTQAALADKVGCRPNTVRELERDEYQPALRLAEAIAQELGVVVLDVFPRLEITKGETQRVLGIANGDAKPLCDAGVLPCDSTGHWHRVSYAAVLNLKAERERFRAEWVNFNQAEAKHRLPWWVFASLADDGKFSEVRIGNGILGRKGSRHVRRAEVARVVADLRANRRRVRCPNCGNHVRVGRKAHHKCLGPLGSRAYWFDRRHRAKRRREHSDAVKEALAQRTPIQKAYRVARWYYSRFGSTKMFGRLNRELAAAKNKLVGAPPLPREVLERLYELADTKSRRGARRSQREIAERLSREFPDPVSRDQVKRALQKRGVNNKLGETPLPP